MAEAVRLRAVDIVSAMGSTVSAIVGLGGLILWLTGAFAGAQIANQQLAGLTDQVKTLSARVAQLGDQFNAGPRMDQLQSILRQQAAEAGRIDAMAEQQRKDEETLIKLNTLIEGISAASRDPLRPHR